MRFNRFVCKCFALSGKFPQALIKNKKGAENPPYSAA